MSTLIIQDISDPLKALYKACFQGLEAGGDLKIIWSINRYYSPLYVKQLTLPVSEKSMVLLAEAVSLHAVESSSND